MTTPSDLIARIQEKRDTTQSAFQTHQDNVVLLIQQMQNHLRDLQTKLQDLGQKQQDFTTKLDQIFQTLEQEISRNSGFIASLSPNNTLSKQEMVAQKRVVLLQSLKQMEGSLKQLDQDITNGQNQVQQGLQQIQKDGDSVRNSLQDIITELTSFDKEVKALESQAQMAVPVTDQPPPVVTAGNKNTAPMPSSTAVDNEILTKLGQAENALIALKQALEKSRLFERVVYNINDFGHRYNLQ
jgi:DNA repair exonuclease SbcCD ATPase subunit